MCIPITLFVIGLPANTSPYIAINVNYYLHNVGLFPPLLCLTTGIEVFLKMSLRQGIRKALAFVTGLRPSSNKKFLNIAVNKKTGVATVTLNRPPVNAMNLELLTELSETFDEFEQSKPTGVLITSFSDKVFSTGLDINAMLKPDPVRLRAFLTCLQDMMIKLYGSSCLTTAVINGHAPAGGCIIALCCDYRIMVENFRIGLNETEVGLILTPWLILAMQNTIGKRQTELALTTSRLFKTNEALKVGLIDEMAASKTDAVDKATAFFKRNEPISPLARETTKKRLRGPDIETINKMPATALEDFVSHIMKPEVQQHMEAYFSQIKNKKASAKTF